jgi:drug/metabolite transporter (DMT)-like permease
VTAGITSVIVSMQPVLVALLAIPVLGERFHVVEALGLLLGFVGVVLLLLPKMFSGDLTPQFSTVGIAASVIALLGTTAGYLTQKKTGEHIPFVQGTAVQYATSAVAFLVMSGLAEDRHVDWTPQFVGALMWIVFALSIGSIFLLFALLRAGSAGSVSSLYYLVPPSAAIQAYFLFQETISAVGLIGMALAGLGVMLVMRATGPSGH